MKFYEHIFSQTNVHGIDQVRRSKTRCGQAFWIIVFLTATVFTICQLCGITLSYVTGSVVNTYSFENIRCPLDFEETFMPVYCAQDWIDENIVKKLNVDVVALLIALKELQMPDVYVAKRLEKMLMTTGADAERLVNINALQFEGATYFTPAKISFNFSSFTANSILQKEIDRQNCTKAWDLLTLVAKDQVQDSKSYVPRLGTLCRFAKFQAFNKSERVYPIMESRKVFSAEQYSEEPLEDTPMFQILLTPRNPEKKSDSPTMPLHPLLEGYMFTSSESYRQSKQTEISQFKKNNTVLDYYFVLDAILRKRVNSDPGRCRDYNKLPFTDQEGLISYCSIFCENEAKFVFDSDEFDYESAAIQVDMFMKPLVFVFNDTVHPDFENNTEISADESAVCLSKCKKVKPPCVENKVTMRIANILENKNMQNADFPNTSKVYSWSRKRNFYFKLQQYIVIQESLKMGFIDFVGALGGSLGMFMGASIISLLQFTINCCHPSCSSMKHDDEIVPIV